MKKIIFFFAVITLAGLTGCKMVSGEKYEQEVNKNDSLMVLTLQHANEIAELSSTMNSLSAKLDEINGELSLSNNDTNLLTQRKHLLEQLQKVQDKINAKQNELDEMQKKYGSVLAKNKELNKTVERLKTDIVDFMNKIASYEEVVEVQTKTIASLNQDLSNVQQNLEEKIEESTKQQEIIDVQDKLLNEGYYIIASKSKLKDLGLVDGGLFSKTRLARGTFDTSAFTKIDIREVTEIAIDSKDAKILSSAPESSYELVKDEDKKLKLVIKDPSLFWSQSKFLVIKI